MSSNFFQHRANGVQPERGYEQVQVIHIHNGTPADIGICTCGAGAVGAPGCTCKKGASAACSNDEHCKCNDCRSRRFLRRVGIAVLVLFLILFGIAAYEVGGWFGEPQQQPEQGGRGLLTVERRLEEALERRTPKGGDENPGLLCKLLGKGGRRPQFCN